MGPETSPPGNVIITTLSDRWCVSEAIPWKVVIKGRESEHLCGTIIYDLRGLKNVRPRNFHPSYWMRTRRMGVGGRYLIPMIVEQCFLTIRTIGNVE